MSNNILKDQGSQYVTSVSIASGQTQTAAITLGKKALLAVYIPATMTGTTLTVYMSDSVAGTYDPLCDITGTNVSFAISAGTAKWYYIEPAKSVAAQFVKLTSSGAEGGTRTLKVLVRSV